MKTTLNLSPDRRILTLITGTRRCSIDLCGALWARMYDLVALREFKVDTFEVRLAHPLADGLRLQFINEAHGLFIPVEFRVTNAGFGVTVKAGWICEQMAINRKLMALDVLPRLLATQVDDPGFYLLPDYCGALARFKKHAPSVNLDRLYMHQSEWEKLNVLNCFGLKQGRQGTLVIVHRGDFFCHAVTEMNQDGANRLYARFGLRHEPAEPVKQEDKEILVRFTEGRKDDYFDLVLAYRDYLVRKRGVAALKDRIADSPALAYSVRAMRTKIFHGLKPDSLDGNVPMRVYATFEETEQILDRMKDAGISRAVVTLVGWNLGGHDGAYPRKFPVEPALGGEDGLRKLIAKAKGMGYQIVPHDNLTDMSLASPGYDADVVLRHADHTPVLGGVWGGGQAVKACPVAYFERYGADVTRIRGLGFDGHYYCDSQSNPLYRCHDPRHPADEEQFAISQCKLTQAYRAIYGAVSQELAPAYALPFTDEIARVHGPHHAARILGAYDEGFRAIIDRVVPFYQLAIHGLVTYQEDWVHCYRAEGVARGVLRALAFGARPCMEVSFRNGANGDCCTDSIRDIRELHQLAFGDLADTHAELVEDHEELAATVSRIVYANGTAVTVNWGDEAMDDLPPRSCRWQAGETPPRLWRAREE